MPAIQGSSYNYYDILEVSPHCAQHEVTVAYEKAKLTYSGDNPAIYTIFSDEEARDLLKLVEEAYSVLGNKTLRSLYDEKLGQVSVTKDSVSFAALTAQSKALYPEMPARTPGTRPDYKIDDGFETEIKNQTEWNGAFLGKVRDYKKIPVPKMSEITKISAYYINAIEREDSKNLPAPVFIRGYVAQIAKVLGLDERKVCDSYMKSFKESLEKSK